ncbi:MAG TPA: class I SAM-dependent methyltransferase, partial [Beijerinckia sp.]|nr:class I SAM-dependent methyltransferase [Beijerinckia sp.]
MSGFSTQWLALREPADHRARNAQIRASAVVPFANRDHISIADLACGTGSNLRGLAAHLPARQTWRLVDNDPHLLAAARDTLIAWADSWKDNDPLILLKDGRHIEVVFAQVDLAANPGVALESPLDLVTSAAFFDLVSEAWIETFCAELSRRALPIYTILTYSGEAVWQPPHAIDAAILSAFHQHQGQDKG